MVDILKPAGMNDRWAESGLKSQPTPSKIDVGWEIEKPPYQVQNWLDNKQDNFNAHVNQHGIPYKDDETEYQAGKSYVVDPISGIVYRCVMTHVGQPVTNPTYWDVAFSPYEAMVPTGSTQMFAGSIAPRGWLIADGSAVSRTQYAALFSVIGTMYGAGDGSTTFNLPDMRGVVVRGVDRSRGLDPNRVQGTYQADLFASHTHNNTATSAQAGQHAHTASTGRAGAHTHSFPISYTYGAVGTVVRGSYGNNATGQMPQSGEHSHTVSVAQAGNHSHSITVNNASTGGTETRMKNIAMLGIIKF